ncbi:hypothetical protein PM082_008379 [Marasmius tenuissimus]|nr:hypothetical protein PM082_008379 [Marasmius tenuissimus]
MKDPSPYQAGLFHVAKKLNSNLPAGRKLKLIDLQHCLKANVKVMAEVKKGKESLKVKSGQSNSRNTVQQRSLGQKAQVRE